MKNTIHRKSTLIKARSKVNNGLFNINEDYCFYKECNDWKYKDDTTGRTYITTANQIRSFFDIIAQC